MPTKQEYIENLGWRLDDLKREIIKTQKRIQVLFREVELKQEQAQHLMMLLKLDGIDINDPELASLTDVAISDVVYDLLDNGEKQSPIHYNEITKIIMSKGILIPGKNPSSNLLSHINRDDRFARTAPGTYGLKKWGLKETSPRKRKINRKRKT